MCRLDQKFISGHVTQAIIDDFEAIQIQEKQCEGMVSMSLGGRVEPEQIVEEQRAIGQAGQGIVERGLFEF